MIIHKIKSELLGKKLNIDLVGAGGNGSQMLTGLARMELALHAVGHPGMHVTIYDPDVVTDANVGRQLFYPSDIGQNKAQVLVHRLNCCYGFQWDAVPLLSSGSTGPANIVIGCVDNVASRRAIGKSRCDYWLDLGNRDKTGQVILGQPKNKWNDEDWTRPRTVLEIFPELNRGKFKEDNTPSCSLAGALDKQDLYINQTVSTMALNLLWSFIRTGQLTHHGYFINLITGRINPLPLIDLLRPVLGPLAGEKTKQAPVRKNSRKPTKRKKK